MSKEIEDKIKSLLNKIQQTKSKQTEIEIANGYLPEIVGDLNSFNPEIQRGVAIMNEMFGDPEQSN